MPGETGFGRAHEMWIMVNNSILLAQVEVDLMSRAYCTRGFACETLEHNHSFEDCGQ